MLARWRSWPVEGTTLLTRACKGKSAGVMESAHKLIAILGICFLFAVISPTLTRILTRECECECEEPVVEATGTGEIETSDDN